MTEKSMEERSDMVERVAKAILVANGHSADEVWSTTHINPAHVEEIPAWTFYMSDARAAIAAMRDLPEELVIEGMKSWLSKTAPVEPLKRWAFAGNTTPKRYMSLGARMISGEQMIAANHAIIDAALAEKEKADG